MTDYVSVRDLAVAAVIGVHPWEREIEQTLVVSVDMAADVARAAASDDLADALDYSAVAATIRAHLRSPGEMFQPRADNARHVGWPDRHH